MIEEDKETYEVIVSLTASQHDRNLTMRRIRQRLHAARITADSVMVGTVNFLANPAVTIRRLRQRLYVIEPVYRAAVALDRDVWGDPHEARNRLARAIDRSIHNERKIAAGWSISDLEEKEKEIP